MKHIAQVCNGNHTHGVSQICFCSVLFAVITLETVHGCFEINKFFKQWKWGWWGIRGLRQVQSNNLSKASQRAAHNWTLNWNDPHLFDYKIVTICPSFLGMLINYKSSVAWKILFPICFSRLSFQVTSATFFSFPFGKAQWLQVPLDYKNYIDSGLCGPKWKQLTSCHQ